MPAAADVYSTGPACLVDPPCCEGCADHQTIAETGCTWCGEPVGYETEYRYGIDGADLCHASCWDEVCQDRPAPVQTAAEHAAERDEALL